YACFRLAGVGAGASAAGAAALAVGPLRIPVDLHVLQYAGWVLPLVLVAAAVDRRRLTAGALGVAIFTSYYRAAVAAVVLAGASPLVAATGGRAAAGRLAVGAAAAFAALAAVSIPYARLGRSGAVVPIAQRFVGSWTLERLVDPTDARFGMGLAVAL